jgi:hypothetical protein
MAKFDRECSIRDRVEKNAELGRPSSDWGLPDPEGRVNAIQPYEWAADPAAARKAA